MQANIDAEISRAVMSGNFEAVQPLITGFSAEVRRKFLAAETPIEQEAVAAEALATLTSFLRVTRVLRSHISANLQALVGHSSYEGGPRKMHTWHLEG